jgi:ubiquinone/menaquinone biosynthesis C-methylase UbiE
MGINIDNGKEYDWGNTSLDYARYRDIYPDSLFKKLQAIGIGNSSQTIVDLGTGTGAVPRQFKKCGAKFIGVDISTAQIEQAKRLSNKSDTLNWIVAPAENTGLQNEIADVVMACQCFIYFDKTKLVPEVLRILKTEGVFVKVSMIWLPFEDELAKKTEEMILKYNPDWTGANYTRRPLQISAWSLEKFTPVTLHTYDAKIPFNRESWRGRIRACRGMGASAISESLKRKFDSEFKEYLKKSKPYNFTVLHQVGIEAYKAKKE